MLELPQLETTDSREQQAMLPETQEKAHCLAHLSPSHESLQNAKPNEVARFLDLRTHDRGAGRELLCVVVGLQQKGIWESLGGLEKVAVRTADCDPAQHSGC